MAVGERRAARLEAESGEAVEDDRREIIEVADQEGEEADIECLAHQALHHVFIGAPGPEQSGERDVDDDQGRGQEGDLALEQAEAGIDVGGEGVEEGVDDADIVHGRASPLTAGAGAAGVVTGPRRLTEEATAVLLPDRAATRIFGVLGAERVAAAQLGREVVGDAETSGHVERGRRRGVPMDCGQSRQERPIRTMTAAGAKDVRSPIMDSASVAAEHRDVARHVAVARREQLVLGLPLRLVGDRRAPVRAHRPELSPKAQRRGRRVCWECSARSWLPAWAACSAPDADWLEVTSDDIAVVLVPMLPTTPAWIFNESWNAPSDVCHRVWAAAVSAALEHSPAVAHRWPRTPAGSC